MSWEFNSVLEWANAVAAGTCRDVTANEVKTLVKHMSDATLEDALSNWTGNEDILAVLNEEYKNRNLDKPCEGCRM